MLVNDLIFYLIIKWNMW